MAVTAKGHVTDWPQSLVWALFDTYYGAEEALKGLIRAEHAWMVDIKNAAVVSRDKEGVVAINQTHDHSTLKGLGTGALVGGLVGLVFPPALLASAAAGAAVGGVGARLRDAGFDDSALRAVASRLEPNQSALVALVRNQWVEDVVLFLDRVAYVVGRDELTERAADALLGHDAAR